MTKLALYLSEIIFCSCDEFSAGAFSASCFRRIFLDSFKYRRDYECLLKNSDILFGSEYKPEIQISQAADNNSFLVRWNERVVIILSYAELLR